MNTEPTTESLRNSTFSVKELKVLDLLRHSAGASQRELAERSGLSLGMVNLVLRRLAKTGYIKISSLDRRKMKYLLTPKAMTDQYRRVYEYLIRTIRIYEQYRKGIETLIDDQIQKGQKQFIVYGEGDIVELVKVVLNARNGQIRYRHCPTPAASKPLMDELPLHCQWQGESPVEGISILETILNHPTDLVGGLHA